MTVSEALILIGMLLKFTTGYFVFIAVRWIFMKRKEWTAAAPNIRFAVVIAARNEENVIGRIVKSLQHQCYPKALYDIYVVPNNCTDLTEDIALRAGAKILRCEYPVRSKGDALRQAFYQLERQNYDAYVVFDADNIVDPHYLKHTNDAFSAGAQVVKGKQVAMNPKDSWVAGCYDIYFAGFDLLYNHPRANAGLPVKLVGTGFAFRHSVLEQLGGWDTQTIAEDAEFAARCAMAHIPVCWAPDAITYDEEPQSLSVSLQQRKRWSSGVIQVGRLMLPEMLIYGSGKCNRDMLFFLLTSQLTPLSLLLTGIGFVMNGFTGETFFRVLFTFIGYWVIGMIAATILLSIERPKEARNSISVVLFPLFMLSWVPLQLLAFFHNTTVWKEIRHGILCKKDYA